MSHPGVNPIVVDLDGTLIKSDLLLETASRFLLDRPFRCWQLLTWLLAGRSTLKTKLAQAAPVDVASLPYNKPLLAWLQAQKAAGRRLVLATASHELLAQQVAEHLGLFDEVLASDAKLNLKSGAKRDALVQRYGAQGFDYVGNDSPDVAVWQASAQAHVVSRSKGLIARAHADGRTGQVFDDGRPAILGALLKAMRPHQWVKNILVFIPLLTAHKWGDPASLALALTAFVVFSLIASSVYLLNDLVDVADDRHHSRKRHRPFAAGNLSLAWGWIAWPLLLLLGLLLAVLTMPGAFVACVVAYFVLTLAYSLRLKQVPVVDVLGLAGLYTLRIIAGVAAIGVGLSFWLLAFSMFLFLSLALIKRYSELLAARAQGQNTALRGRGYLPQDVEIIASLGASAGYIAVLVLALYIQDGRTASMYASPTVIWFSCPALLYWISRVWLIAHRGQLHSDPIVFALKDPASWCVAALFVAVFALAKLAF